MTIQNEKEIEKRVIDFRKRSYALLKLQASLEGESMVEVIEKALEQYADESIKMIINNKYGEWTERPKKPCGRKPKVNKQETTESEVKEQEIKTDKTIESEVKEQEIKTDKTIESEVKEQEIKADETIESEVKEQEIKADKTIESEVKEQEIKTDKITESEIKNEESKVIEKTEQSEVATTGESDYEEIDDDTLSCYM